MSSRRSLFLAGLRSAIPLLFGVMPSGFIYGVLAVNAGLEPSTAVGMSLIVYAGSAQFIATRLFGAGTPGLIIVLTTLAVNLRHLLYSTSMAPYLRHLSTRWKLPLAFLLTDESYALSISYYRASDTDPDLSPHRHWFLLGAGLTLWTSWQIGTVVGVYLGGQAPHGWSLDFTLALTFIALVVPMLVDRPSALSALVAGIIALLGTGLPYSLGLMAAVVVGVAIGTILEAPTTHVQPDREGDAQ